MKKSIYTWLLCAGLASCAKNYYTSSTIRPTLTSRFITLDESYRLYIRQLYKVTVGNKTEKKGNLSPNFSDTSSLIEVEYLLISDLHNNAIYFSTIPDKYMTYYATELLGENVINIYDLKNVLFGKIDLTGNIHFEARKSNQKNIWNICYKQQRENTFLLLTTISEEIDNAFENMIPLAPALQDEINFKQAPNFTIAFRKRGEKDLAYLADNRLHLNYKENIIELKFILDRQIEFNQGWSNEIYFKDERIRSKPDALLDR